MSLDIYLEGPKQTVTCVCRECWNEHERETFEEFFSANITHNLGRMAREAGIYEVLWHPNEHGFYKAGQIIEKLKEGLGWLKIDPEHFAQFNAENGWGTYKHFVPFVESVLEACKKYPDAFVRTST